MTRKELLSQKVIKVVLSFLLVVSTSATCIYATEGETVSTPDTTLVEETTDSTLSEGEVTEPEETEEVVEENKEEETVEDSQEEEKEESQETEDNNQEAQESEETQDSLEEAEDTKNNDAKNAVADRSEADDALEDEIEVINEEDEEVEVYSNDISIEAPKAVLNDVTYDTLEAAVNAATSGSTITLGKGKYTLYNKGAQTKGKDLTFVGQGSDTQWGIGATVPDPSKFGTEYNGDYSFDGAGTITFNNMTLQSGSAAYLGFIRADKTVVNNCTINGQTYYWGYTSATFKNTTFNAPNYEYAIGTYSSPIMTFDTCIFNTYGKAINVYRDYAGATYVININNCTVNNTKSSSLKEWIQGTKQFLNINDTVPSGQSYVINFTGTNTVSGSKALNRDNSTCSQLYGFGNNSGNNAGHTTVNIEGVTVFTNKKLVDHELEKSVNGNTVHGSDGHRDNKYTEITKEVTLDDGTVLVETVKKCDYCGWTSDASYEYKFGGNVVISGDDVIVKDSSKDNYEVNYRATYNMSDELYNKIILSQQFINDTNTTLTFTVQLDSRLSVKKNDDGSYYYDFQSPIFYVDNNGIKVNNDNTLTVTCKLKSDWKDHLGNSASDLKMTLDGIGLLPKDSFKVGEKLSTTGRIDVHVVPNYGNPYDVPVVANVYETAMKMQYVLNYDANGGSISVTKTESDVTQETTFELTVTSEQPTRSGYTFVGWASSASATNSDIGATVALDEENYEKTIYALWQQNSTPSPTPTPRPTSTPDSGYTPCPDGMQWNEDAKVCEVIPTPTPTTTPTVVPAVVPVNPGNNDTTPTVTPEQTPQATQTPTPTPTTTPEAVEVEEEETPLVLNGHWALVNLISALVSILLAIILLVAKHEKDNDEDDETISDENQENTLTRNRRWKVVSAIVAIASVVVFVLTENMRLPMVMVDKYTLLMVVLALVNVVTLYFGKKWHEPDQENQEEM